MTCLNGSADNASEFDGCLHNESRRRRVSLVNTNQVLPAVNPIAFDYLCEPLREAGYEVEVLDLCMSADVGRKIAEYCTKLRPDVWGVTLRNTDDVYLSSGQEFLSGIRQIIAQLRSHCDVPVVLGGVGFSVMPEEILEYMSADYGIVCEGEISFPMLLDRVFSGRGVQDVPGLVYRAGASIHRTPLGKFVDLARVGVRSRDLVDNLAYFQQGGQIGIETKRGCNRQCIYCVEPLVKGRKIRFRRPEQVVDEFERLVDRGIHAFHINDSEFNLNIEHPIAICDEIIRRGLDTKMSWYAYGMPAPFPDRLAAKMRAAGCAGMNFGVDSASASILRTLRRTFDKADIADAVSTAQRNGLEHIVELLLGAPGESLGTVTESIEFMKQIQPDRVSVTIGLRVFPGTELADMLRREGSLRTVDGVELSPHDSALLEPVFYVSEQLGDDPVGLVDRIIGGDSRFFGVNTKRFNYNANDELVRAISQGERGAYWSILSRIEQGMVSGERSAREPLSSARTMSRHGCGQTGYEAIE